MSRDEEEKGLNKNTHKENLLIIGTEWQENLVEFPSLRILGTRQMCESGTDAPGNSFLSLEL